MIGFIIGIAATIGIEVLAIKFRGPQIIAWLATKFPSLAAKGTPNP